MLVLASSPGSERAEARCECSVAAHATVFAPLDALAELRETPGPPTSPPVPPRFLRHADEQTVVGMAAVLQAMSQTPMQGTDFTDWGVLAAPRLQGRLGSAATLCKFGQMGPAAVSPHAIPQNSMHAISSAISVALGMHGPNFGVGGGQEAPDEGLMVALTLLQRTHLPGLWLVLTEWDVEPVPDGIGGSTTPAVCRAAALALVPSRPGRGWLRWTPQRARGVRTSDLTTWLANFPATGEDGMWSLPLAWGGQIDLVLAGQAQQRKAA